MAEQAVERTRRSMGESSGGGARDLANDLGVNVLLEYPPLVWRSNPAWLTVRYVSADSFRRSATGRPRPSRPFGIRPVDFADEPRRESPRAPVPNRDSPMDVLEEMAVASADPQQSAAAADRSELTGSICSGPLRLGLWCVGLS